MSASNSYNPLDKANLGKSVADALLEKQLEPLAKIARFDGAGVYAIHYLGEFSAYSSPRLARGNESTAVPIYVGKAVPPGSRKGNAGLDADPGRVLFNRLGEHASSIDDATNLDVSDFSCRYLVVDDIWIPLGESLLIARFSPVWNQFLDGFGNHNPGKGRYEQLRSRWDTLHPGRSWAVKCRERPESADQILSEIAAFFTN